MDCDAFYASVEKRDNPDLLDKPIIIGGGNRGVVSTACYIARIKGVKSAMPMFQALRKCPEAIVIRPRMELYANISKSIRQMMFELTPAVEPLSLDEAYLDVTDVIQQNVTPPQIAKKLKESISSDLGLTISIGVSTSKSVSKIASGINKPDGLTVVRPGDEISFLHPLPIEVVWGIGPKSSEKLHNLSINTVGDLSAQPIKVLSDIFGSNAMYIKNIANGVDLRPVITQRERKSISSETTLLVDTSDRGDLTEIVMRLSGQVADSLIQKDIRGRTVKLKLKRSNFTTLTRQKTLLEKVQISSEITESALELLNYELKNSDEKYRLIGVGVSGFSSAESLHDEMQLRFEGL